MLGRPSAKLDVRRFAGRAWDLDDLAARYAAFVAQFRDHARKPPAGAAAFDVRTRLVHTFRAFPSLDPELPDDLVPPPVQRAAAVELFHDLYQALAPDAQRHFDEVTTP